MQFYLIFALILFLPRRFMLPALGLWAGVNLFGFLMGWQQWGASFSIIFSVLSLEFIAGAFAGWLVKQQVYSFAKPMFIGGIIASLAAVVFYTDQSRNMTAWGRVVVYTLPFTALIYGASALERQNKLRCPSWLVHLGDWSYSLYLSHYLVLICIIRIAREAKPYLPDSLVKTFSMGAPGIWDNIIFTFAAITLSVLTAGLSYYIIERPVLRAARRLKT
jgi:peptidoglycan/LPS O-acetylase OafA/YrhL